MKRIAGESRAELAAWIIQNAIRCWGAGMDLDDAAELAASECGFPINSATFGRTMRYLKKIGAIRHKVGRKKQFKGAPVKLNAKRWAAMDIAIRHLHPWLVIERWTLAAVQRRLARECGRADEAAVAEALKMAGFTIDRSDDIQRVIMRKGTR